MPSHPWDRDTTQCHTQVSWQWHPPKSGQKFLSVTQFSSLHTLKKKEDIILSKVFSYFTYQHVCYTGNNWAIRNCLVRTQERKHRLHESQLFLALRIIQQPTASFSKKSPVSQSKLPKFVKHMQWREIEQNQAKWFFDIWPLASCTAHQKWWHVSQWPRASFLTKPTYSYPPAGDKYV